MAVGRRERFAQTELLKQRLRYRCDVLKRSRKAQREEFDGGRVDHVGEAIKETVGSLRHWRQRVITAAEIEQRRVAARRRHAEESAATQICRAAVEIAVRSLRDAHRIGGFRAARKGVQDGIATARGQLETPPAAQAAAYVTGEIAAIAGGSVEVAVAGGDDVVGG